MRDHGETGDTALNNPSDTSRDMFEESSRRDPEFEMPDQEQVEREIEQAERIFGNKRPLEEPDEAA